MSVDITAKIGGNEYSVSIIKRFLCEYFKCEANTERIDTGKYRFTDFYENDDIILFFVDNSKLCYWDSIILNREYRYQQSFIFDVSKFSDMNRSCETVLKFIIELQKNVNQEMLVTSSIHDEICYINTDSKVTWSNKWKNN